MLIGMPAICYFIYFIMQYLFSIQNYLGYESGG